jgi:uridine kinase
VVRTAVRAISADLRARGERATHLIGIDGPGGAGKSTLARALAAELGAVVVAGDDFHRTGGSRAAGGSAGDEYDWRKLEAQVLAPAAAGRSIRYQRYDWGRDALAEWRTVAAGTPLVVEGVYVLRTELRDYFTYTVWVDTRRDVRLRRGLERDGRQARSDWLKWMEREDEYMRSHRPRDTADRVVAGERPPALRVGHGACRDQARSTVDPL